MLAWVELNVCLGSMSAILANKDYYSYGLRAGKTFAGVGFIVEMIVIAEDFALGPLFDILGRKWLLIIG